jgi:alcohol dehydrogenase class IV
MNAVSLPAALRFNTDAAASELARFGEAIDRGDPVARVSELAALAGPSRLSEYEVPREDLPELAQAIAQRPPAKANPRPAPPDGVLSCWRRCGDQNRSEMSESTRILTTHAARGGGS